MPNWLKPKLLERPDTDTIDQLCTLASQQIAIREMCNREEYFDDGFNEITESNTDKMLKAITVQCCAMLGRTLSNVKVKFNGELDAH